MKRAHVADIMGVEVSTVARWETSDVPNDSPTMAQAIKLSELYRRPLAAFYLRELPTTNRVATTDFRLMVNRDDSADYLLAFEERRASERRNVMIELSESDDEGYFEYLGTVSLSHRPQEVARDIRSQLQITLAMQFKWREPRVAFSAWRSAIERLNVLVFVSSNLQNGMPKEVARAFSFSEPRYPVIVVNGFDTHAGRVFSLLHEYVHLLLNISGVCDENRTRFSERNKGVEAFCNSVAAEALTPKESVLEHRIVRMHKEGVPWTDREIEILAKDYCVSEEVIVLRLVSIGKASQEFYQEKKAEYESRLEAIKLAESDGTKVTYGQKYYKKVLNWNGRPFTRQVLGAYHEGNITLSDVSSFLSAQAKYVNDIRREAFSTPGA